MPYKWTFVVLELTSHIKVLSAVLPAAGLGLTTAAALDAFAFETAALALVNAAFAASAPAPVRGDEGAFCTAGGVLSCAVAICAAPNAAATKITAIVQRRC